LPISCRDHLIKAFLLAYSVRSINDIWDWIIMGLGGGMMVPLILRMYWWRFNGGGFATGMLFGTVAAIAQRGPVPVLGVRHISAARLR